MTRSISPSRAAQRGFTLIELMIVVAIIGMLASIAVPLFKRALIRSRRNAALNDLRVLRDELQKYASDNGSYPVWGALDTATLSPLAPTYIRSPRSILKNLSNQRLSLYISWNIFDEPLASDIFTSPQGFLVMGTLAVAPSIYLYVTDGSMYYYQDGVLTNVGKN